jgi:hypothetical protein
VSIPLALAMIGSAFHPVPRVTTQRAQSLATQERIATTIDSTPAPQEYSSIATRQEDFNKSVPARSGETLTITLADIGGNVTISGWAADSVHVRARFGGRGGLDTEVRLEATSRGAELRTAYKGKEGTIDFSRHFEIRVPSHYNVVLMSAAGAINIRDVRGNFSGATGIGEIVVERVRGVLALSTGLGEVYVGNSELDGRVTTNWGNVRFENVTGDLRRNAMSATTMPGQRADRTAPDIDVKADDSHPKYLPILLRSDLALPGSVPIQVALSGEENLVIINETVADPLHLRAAIELVKQVRAKYGRSIPGGTVHMPVAERAPSTNPRDAEPYAQLMDQLRFAPTEVINGRPSARHYTFQEHPEVEIAVSESTLARLMRSGTGAGR